MAKFLDFYDHVMPYVPGVQSEFVDFHLRKALREFFRRTSVWRTVVAVNLTANSTSAALVIPDGKVQSVLTVSLDRSKTPLPVTPESRRYPRGATVARGQPASWFTVEPDRLYLQPLPDGAYTLHIDCVTTLPEDATCKTVPCFVLEHYHEDIANGTIASLTAMAGKPWTHPELSKYHRDMFVRRMLSLRAIHRDGGQPNASTFSGPRFGR